MICSDRLPNIIPPLVPAELDTFSQRYAELRDLVARIQAGNEIGAQDLYRVLGRGMKWFLSREVGADRAQDELHNLFVILLEHVRQGNVRDPERLMGMARTIAHRQVAAHIDLRMKTHERESDEGMLSRVPSRLPTAEEALATKERVDLMKRVIGEMSRRDREILTKFYLHECTPEQICGEMVLSDTQFRLLRTRAKDRFGELGRKKMTLAKLLRLCIVPFAQSVYLGVLSKKNACR